MLKKNVITLIMILSFFLAVPRVTFAVNATVQHTEQQSFVTIARESMPAVVNISTTRLVKNTQMPDQFRNFFGDEFLKKFFDTPQGNSRQTSLGSGVIVNKRGFILTNNHVIDGADEILVKLNDSREFKGKVIGTDPKTDLAVIKIEADKLTEIKLGDSDKIEVGQWAIAIGSPFGFSQTMTVGIVSAKGRSRIGLVDYENFIQTDAAINPGNSGGAMLNIDGELIGINTAIFSRTGGYEGIGFAIPVNMAKSIMDDLMKDGKIVRGWLGVYIQEMDEKLAKQLGIASAQGILFSDITPDGPAARADLRRGDVIIKYDGKNLKGTEDLRNLVAGTKVGRKVPIVVVRNGIEKNMSIEVGQLKDDDAVAGKSDSVQSNKIGLKVETLTESMASGLELRGLQGVVVLDMEEGSPAEKAGIKKGDLIMEVNRKAVTSVDDLNASIADVRKGDSLLICVRRDKYNYYIVVDIDK